MTAAGGQMVRRLGLLIEAVCMLGLVSVARGNGASLRSALRMDPGTVLVTGLALGFCVWAFGTFQILQARRRARSG